MIIQNFNDVDAIDLMEGVKKRIVIGKKVGAPNFIMRIFDLAPGASSPYHNHPWEHEIFVIQGKATIKDETEKETPIGEGDTAFIAPDEKHCLINRGEELFRFMCLIPTSATEE